VAPHSSLLSGRAILAQNLGVLPYRAMRHRPGAWWLPLGILALVTLVMTFPMAFRAGRVGPVNTGDGQWSIWSTCWVARTLVADPLHLYDANIFSPHAGTLAYSEANLAGGALAVPAWWATRNPYFAYNSAILLALLGAAWAAFTLARRLSGSWPAALAGAITFAFAPVVLVRLAHVQLLMVFCLPLALLALHRFVERRTPVTVLSLSGALVLAGLSSGYFGIAAAVAVGLGFTYYGITRRLWRNWRYLAACSCAVLLAAVLVAPFFLPYLQLEAGGAAFRSIEETRRYSADWRSYLASTAHVQRWLLDRVVAHDATAFPERILFPGFLASLLAAVALAGSLRPRGEDGSQPPEWRETAGFYGLLACVAAWLSFGPAAGLYRLAYRFVPGFSLTRAPARLGVLVTLSVAVLASLGCSRITRRWRRPGLAAALVATAVAIELAAVPLDLRNALPVPAAHRALAGLPAGAVAEFPYFFLERDLYRNSLYMLYSTAHWHPLVNGYSDFIPADYRPTMVAISTFPSREAFRLIRERGARYAVFHLQLYDRRSREKLMDALARYKDDLRPLVQADDVWLYEITGWPQ
jgi:hypothetical protein